MDPALILGFITGNKEIIEHIKRYNLGIEKIVLLYPNLFGETNLELKFNHFYPINNDKKKTKIC